MDLAPVLSTVKTCLRTFLLVLLLLLLLASSVWVSPYTNATSHPNDPNAPNLSPSERAELFLEMDIDLLDPSTPEYDHVLKIRSLKEEVDKTIEHASHASLLAAQAEEEYRQAQFEAALARIRAQQAQKSLNRWAAGLYRNDLPVSDGMEVINSSVNDPAAVLDSKIWMVQISQMQDNTLSLAQEYRVQAEAAVEKVHQSFLLTQQAALEAQEAADAMRQSLDAAQVELEEFLTMLEEQHFRRTGQRGVRPGQQILIGPEGCPLEAPVNTLRSGAQDIGVYELCMRSVNSAPTPQAALAIQYTFRVLGSSYACNGAGRTGSRYDCSSLVARAYAEGAGLPTAGPTWSPSTRDMAPWGGHRLAPWLTPIDAEHAQPGDLLVYRSSSSATGHHVVMLLADGFMVHTNRCGDVTHITSFRGWESGLVGVRRVLVDSETFETTDLKEWFNEISSLAPTQQAHDGAIRTHQARGSQLR